MANKKPNQNPNLDSTMPNDAGAPTNDAGQQSDKKKKKNTYN